MAACKVYPDNLLVLQCPFLILVLDFLQVVFLCLNYCFFS